MHIEFERDAAKHIERLDKATKQRIREAIQKLPDERAAIERANESIRKYGTISGDAINWD